MTQAVHIAALSHLDGRSLTTVHGNKLHMQRFQTDASLRWKDAFDSAFPTFRRLDGLSRAVCLATEALDLDQHLPVDERQNTALLLGTSYGCLDADLRFEQSLCDPLGIKPAIFPYTLPSTCLGEAAIRHGLRGGATAHSTQAGQESAALAQAAILLEAGDASSVVVLLGDWLPEGSSCPLGLEPKTEVVAILLRSGHPKQSEATLYDEVHADPFRRIPAALNAP